LIGIKYWANNQIYAIDNGENTKQKIDGQEGCQTVSEQVGAIIWVVTTFDQQCEKPTRGEVAYVQ